MQAQRPDKTARGGKSRHNLTRAKWITLFQLSLLISRLWGSRRSNVSKGAIWTSCCSYLSFDFVTYFKLRAQEGTCQRRSSQGDCVVWRRWRCQEGKSPTLSFLENGQPNPQPHLTSLIPLRCRMRMELALQMKKMRRRRVNRRPSPKRKSSRRLKRNR